MVSQWVKYMKYHTCTTEWWEKMLSIFSPPITVQPLPAVMLMSFTCWENYFMILLWYETIIGDISYCLMAWGKQSYQSGKWIWAKFISIFYQSRLRKCLFVEVGKEKILICQTLHKQLETHGRGFNINATDALVLKRQAISINTVDLIIFVALEHGSFIAKYHIDGEQH